MKKILVLFVIIISVLLFVKVSLNTLQKKIDSALSAQPEQTLEQPSPTPTSPQATKINESLFVPYWSLGDNRLQQSPYATLIYFGVQAGSKGITKNEDGYQNLETFVEQAGNKRKILTLRMIDTETNLSVLKDAKAQDALISQTISLAKQYHFQGVLLNIEVSALPFASLMERITAFNTKFAKAVHAENLSYSITAYGDTFYRVRPFDMQKLSSNVDSVYIMAYDFHKAKGNPGPNFPLRGSEDFGYDYTKMLNNFADAVPLSKLIVVFGMYGYDWEVDDKDVSQGAGEPISLKEVKASVIDTCLHESCLWERDSKSAETKATYQDDENAKHIIWFEDEESVKRKKDFLKKSGVGSYAYWAYSYF